MPAGSTIRLMAAARPGGGVHRWDVRMFPTPGGKADSPTRLGCGSRVAQARDAAQAGKLYALGATNTVPETIEGSLQLSEAVLVTSACLWV